MSKNFCAKYAKGENLIFPEAGVKPTSKIFEISGPGKFIIENIGQDLTPRTLYIPAKAPQGVFTWKQETFEALGGFNTTLKLPSKL